MPRFNDSRLGMWLREPWSDSERGGFHKFGLQEADRERFLNWLSSAFRYVEGKETTAQAALAHVVSFMTGSKEEDMMSEDPARLASIILSIHHTAKADTCRYIEPKCLPFARKVEP